MDPHKLVDDLVAAAKAHAFAGAGHPQDAPGLEQELNEARAAVIDALGVVLEDFDLYDAVSETIAFPIRKHGLDGYPEVDIDKIVEKKIDEMNPSELLRSISEALKG